MTEILFSGSRFKADIFAGTGALPADADLKRINQAEEDFYKQEAERQGLEDGLIFPYGLDFKGFKLPLPVAVTLVKANEARNMFGEEPRLARSADFGIVNDAIWVLGDEYENFNTVINKTNPRQNDGDVERLSKEFGQNIGSYFYSVGSTARVNSQTGSIDMKIGALRVGKVGEHTPEEFQDIFGPHLRKRDAFSIDFVIGESLLDLPPYFEYVEQRVEINSAGAKYTGRSQIEIPNDFSNLPVLRSAAHGVLSAV